MAKGLRMNWNGMGLEDINKIARAKQIIEELGDTFTKKEYDAIRPRKSATVDWLSEKGLISLALDETFEKEILGNSDNDIEVMVTFKGETICSYQDWIYTPSDVREALERTYGKLHSDWRANKETITCHRYHWKWNEGRDVALIEKHIAEVLEYAELKLDELEPKVAKYKAIIALYAED